MNTDKYNILKYIVAITCFVAYVILIVFLFNKVDAAENTWGRYTHLFQGLEVIVFASVGWLFGKEVHREQAKKAEQRADNALKQSEAKEGELKKVKTKLPDLNSYIKIHAPSEDFQMSNVSRGAVASDLKGTEKQIEQTAKADWAKLAKYADSLTLSD